MRMRAMVCALLVAAAAFAQSPPIARLIITSGEDDATIAGAAGAVPPNADVLCETMETGHYTIVRAAPDGSFRATLFAPPGTSILVKSDAAHTQLQQIASLPPLIDFHLSQLISLPGTIVRRDDPPGDAGEIGFGSALVVIDGSTYAPVTVRGSLNRGAFKAGDELKVRVSVTAHDAVPKGASPKARLNLALTPLSGPDGSPRHAQNSFCSTFMTPTGLPVERQQWLYTYYQAMAVAVPVAGGSAATAELQATLPIPAGLPPGYYRPAIKVDLDVTPQRSLQNERITTFIDTPRRGAVSIYLPVIRVGDPAAPRFLLALLMNDVVEAARGATAIEDRGRFAIAPHIITGAERMIVPRLDPATGTILRYNLEPFAPTLAIGDRGAPPAPALIPLRYPSGTLRITIRAPGGALTTLGPLPLQQPVLTGPSRDGNTMEGGGYITDALQLSTIDPQFQIAFAADGVHRVEVDASIDDVWGNRWRGGGTYEIDVARPLVVDPSPIPGTPFEVGDAFAFRAALQPPVAADVEVTLRFAPRSRAAEMVEWRASGRANRFGQIALPSSFRFQQPGEYRVDVAASYTDAGGARRSAALTWGGVVAPAAARIVAHGRRGIDDQQENRQAWYFRTQTGETFGRGHVQIPFHSGDVMWMEDGDAAVPNISFHDPQGTVRPILSRYCCGPQGDDAAGETPPFSGNLQGLDVHLSAADPDIAGYGYAAIERPLVRVREIIGEQGVTAPYWRFNDLYGRQRGTGNKGDLPNDFKFQFGGVVMRGSAIGEPLYAIYGSLFVLVPDNDAGGGTRIFPPFTTDGGPLFRLKGKPVELFFHPTAVRAGTVLVQGDTISFAGYSAPTLPSKIAVEVTSPSGRVRTIKGQANLIGYFHDPGYDFAADEPGVWRAKVTITFDGATSAGQLTAPFPTAEQTFNFYIVRGDAAQLITSVIPTRDTFIVTPPAGLHDLQLAYTATMPGFVLEEGTTAAPAYVYDAQRLATDFPNLEPGVDAVTISLLLSGTDAAGKRQHFARQIVIQGEEVQMPEQKAAPGSPRRRSAR